MNEEKVAEMARDWYSVRGGLTEQFEGTLLDAREKLMYVEERVGSVIHAARQDMRYHQGKLAEHQEEHDRSQEELVNLREFDYADNLQALDVVDRIRKTEANFKYNAALQQVSIDLQPLKDQINPLYDRIIESVRAGQSAIRETDNQVTGLEAQLVRSGR